MNYRPKKGSKTLNLRLSNDGLLSAAHYILTVLREQRSPPFYLKSYPKLRVLRIEWNGEWGRHSLPEEYDIPILRAPPTGFEMKMSREQLEEFSRNAIILSTERRTKASRNRSGVGSLAYHIICLHKHKIPSKSTLAIVSFFEEDGNESKDLERLAGRIRREQERISHCNGDSE